MNDLYFRAILGVPAGATRDEIRVAYRRLVMENHPDRFPAEKKTLQELAMITLTEAYSALMGAAPAAEREPPQSTPRARAGAGNARPSRSALAAHRDPAYAYYKQGFINFSLAIHGVAEINRKLAGGRVPALRRRYTAAEDIKGSLSFLRAAHGYFTRVTMEHAESVWASDARMKLRRIEHFTNIYRRILANLGHG
jgi:DnaJ-class molecular chaperone